MTNPRYSLYAVLARSLSVGPLIISGVAIAGFIVDLPLLISWHRNLPGMALPTAISLFGLSASVFLLTRDRSK